MTYQWPWTHAAPRGGRGPAHTFLYQPMGLALPIHFVDPAIHHYLRNGASMSKSQSDAAYVAIWGTTARRMKEYLPSCPHENQRRKMFEVIVRILYTTMNDPARPNDWTSQLSAIKAILAADQFYKAHEHFPSLPQGLMAKTAHDLSNALKITITCLGARPLREK